MPLEEFIIRVYVCIESSLNTLLDGHRLRQRGVPPRLSDAEILTLLCVGEFLELQTDKRIWSYFKEHYQEWFPGLGSRSAFVRQAANLWHIKQQLQHHLAREMGAIADNLHIVDGFPMPVCHFARARGSRCFSGEADYGFCASKNETYYGFQGVVLINSEGCIAGFTMTPASVDERDAIWDVMEGITGTVLGDKGFIRPVLKEDLARQHCDLQTPLRKNMTDDRDPEFLAWLVSTRRLVETVIGQLVERFHMAKTRARDIWHHTARVARKLLAHTIAIHIAKENNISPLSFDELVEI